MLFIMLSLAYVAVPGHGVPSQRAGCIADHVGMLQVLECVELAPWRS